MSKKKIKFTVEERNKIKKIRVEMSQTFTELGKVAIKRKIHLSNLQKKEEELSSRYFDLVNNEELMIGELTKKYGQGKYDSITDEFTPDDTKNDVES